MIDQALNLEEIWQHAPNWVLDMVGRLKNTVPYLIRITCVLVSFISIRPPGKSSFTRVHLDMHHPGIGTIRVRATYKLCFYHAWLRARAGDSTKKVSPNPNGAYPRVVHIQVNTCMRRATFRERQDLIFERILYLIQHSKHFY